VSEVLASVIKEEPKLERAPVKVRRLLGVCLEKDPKHRLRAIGDWRLLLDTTPASAAANRGIARWIWLAALVALAIALGIALWALWHPKQPEDRPLVPLDMDLGADVPLPAIANVTNLAISPDGTRLVYASGTPTKLFTRRLDQSKANELPGTQGASRPFFLPDGQWVGFTLGEKLNKISVEGGAVVPLVDTHTFVGASWAGDGSIIAGQVYRKEGLLRVNAAGGPPEKIAEVGDGEIGFALPQILPGAKAILFQTGREMNADQFNIEVLTLADHRRKVVAQSGTTARFLPTSGRSSGPGHLIYINKATMFAVPFDLDKLETRGTAVPVLDDVAYQAAVGTGQFDVSWGPSGHGTLVYRKAADQAAAMTRLEWVDPSGKRDPLGPSRTHTCL
jgi:serine/threonine-protein kinase